MRCLAAGIVALLPALAWMGCGYVGEPLPPALRLPVRITDLAAVERGSKIIVHFTLPTVTTEALPIKKGEEDIDLRVGPVAGDFNRQAWEASADRITQIPRDNNLATVEVPAARYYGKTVFINVTSRGPRGRSAGPSNYVILPVVMALPTPEAVTAANAPDAVRLEWHAAAGEFRVYRRENEKQPWALSGTVTKPFYVDPAIEYGKTYEYFVQSVEKVQDTYAESELSQIVSFKPEDHFPPAPPSGLTAVIGARTIELAWDRNAEKDFASYRVYRNGQKAAEGLTAPAWSDKDAMPGVKYQYQVSALDKAGNESAKSPAIEAAIP